MKSIKPTIQLTNLQQASLDKYSIKQGSGKLSRNRALLVDTGLSIGRSPKDRFIVEDAFDLNLISTMPNIFIVLIGFCTSHHYFLVF